MRTMEDLAYDLDRIADAAGKRATESKSMFESTEKHNGRVAIMGSYAAVFKDLSKLMLERTTPDDLIRIIKNM